MDKAAIEKVVHEYIAAHGEELVTSMEAAQKRQKQEALKKMINENTPTIGPVDAPVTVVEFSDFQCPFCGKVQPTVNDLRAKYGMKVRWAFKNLPLSFHPQAQPAAQAAEAARMQGKFWEYSKQLWANQATLNDATFAKIATDLKLDMKKFEADRISDKVKKIINDDLQDAQAAGASGTPFFLINGEGTSGAVPLEAFTTIIDGELAKK
jgi:protein-disulfide isomerase